MSKCGKLFISNLFPKCSDWFLNGINFPLKWWLIYYIAQFVPPGDLKHDQRTHGYEQACITSVTRDSCQNWLVHQNESHAQTVSVSAVPSISFRNVNETCDTQCHLWNTKPQRGDDSAAHKRPCKRYKV